MANKRSVIRLGKQNGTGSRRLCLGIGDRRLYCVFPQRKKRSIFDMTKWEYKTTVFKAEGWFAGGKIDKPAMDEMLNDLGSQGWELVGAFNTSMLEGATRLVVFMFKRPTD